LSETPRKATASITTNTAGATINTLQSRARSGLFLTQALPEQQGKNKPQQSEEREGVLMPFFSESYLDSLSKSKRNELYNTCTFLGYHPETQDYFLIPDTDRYAGMYVLGVQGVGKSSLLESLIYQDIEKGHAVFVIDPHGDLIDHVIGQVEADDETTCNRMFLFDMQDEAHPFGVNVFSGQKHQSSIAITQAVDRVMHIFEVLWGDVLNQQNLPRYLRAATIVLFANPGSTLVDMYDFLLNDSLREKMLKNVTDPTITQFWQYQYDSKTPAVRTKEIAPLINRLEALFMGRSLVRNIVGQSANTIDFRKAIENKEILLIKLPLKTLPQDARLIGTMLIAQIHAAVFSFADLPQHQRPGFSLFIDEFQHFVTSDIAEIFAEGRKFGSRLCVAHQRRDQIPDYLANATLSARTKICFQTTPSDAWEMARVFETAETEVKPDSIDPEPVDYLLTYGHDDPDIKTFIDWYLRPLQSMKKSGRIEVTTWNVPFGVELLLNTMGSYIPEKPKVLDPEPYLNNLLYQVMKTQDSTLPIPLEVVYGFSNCGNGFYIVWDSQKKDAKAWYVSADVRFPEELLVETADHKLRWLRAPKNSDEQFFHFLFFLRRTMLRLADDPIGEKTVKTPAEIARMLTSLPRRTAFIRSGEDVATIFTEDTPEVVSEYLFNNRVERIREHTREKYCMSKDEDEMDMQMRSGARGIEDTRLGEVTGSGAGAEPEPVELPQPAISLLEPKAHKEPEEQTPKPVAATMSMDTMNVLYTQMKTKALDPQTVILASLGEHYVMTIKQWMRLFEWKTYPKATTHFKELKENDMIYRKDREGRGGTFVEGDWFFLLTKGGNELVKRKQATPLFKLEPNEAEKTSGDTLFHTYLVNEILIHLRLLERSHPGIITIERIDHERSMRRTYLTALGADSKLYPDGFLRLLVPTPNGLKRRYSFLELQNTTQKDEANWKTKCRKYLALFERADVLEKFFSTRIPRVLVITMDAEYVLHHKQWTEEVLAEAGAKGHTFSNRFIIGSYDPGISDMTTPPAQFFCTPRFHTPFHDTPHAVFGS
jgi:hypothetical protein